MIYFGTTINGKFPIATSKELSGRGVKKMTNEKSKVITFKGEIIKGLYQYSLTEKAFNKLKQTNEVAWTEI